MDPEPNVPADPSDLDLALRLADLADAITLPRFRAADLRVTRKPDRTPVTDADTSAEDAIRAALGHERPRDAILGEERGGDVDGARAAGRGWVIDPIDGTKNFSRGVPAWATLIALVVDGVPVAGVVSAPALQRRWWGSAGAGAWARDLPSGTPRRIAVSGVADLADAYVSTTNQDTFRTEPGPVPRDGWTRLTEACWESRGFGDFWQHVLVAEGVLDVAVEPAANPWDLAAPAVVVAEAGGRLTDLTGEPTWSGGHGLTSNGLLHDTVVEVLRG
ncbi:MULTISPECIES: inositol monophosphatase family protein [unclassified Pseudonocardia]|uniref:inositol monophosphatase family protein n=1 Tax=unclassified Pseudonocardia TaxID=2619320 RepID=UPI0001FFEB11|nr:MULTISPECIES: inositol monophosphatase family protein [unclassified Pseudonocardia]OLM20579.1 Histidinol-phosphatase [alternative form] [Pseudonocardia sp. Ae707_Ps1]